MIPGFLFADKGDRRIKSVSLLRSSLPPSLPRSVGRSVRYSVRRRRGEGEVEAAFVCIATSPPRPAASPATTGRTRTDGGRSSPLARCLSPPPPRILRNSLLGLPPSFPPSLPLSLPPSLPPSLSRPRSFARSLARHIADDIFSVSPSLPWPSLLPSFLPSFAVIAGNCEIATRARRRDRPTDRRDGAALQFPPKFWD